jgi:hypothetical protein
LLLVACALTGCGAQRHLARVVQTVAAPAQTQPTVKPRYYPDRTPIRFFSAQSPWNVPLGGDEPLDPGSARLVRELAGEAAGKRGESGTRLSATSESTPIYTVSAHQPTVRVALSSSSPQSALSSAWSVVPLPPDARPAFGSQACLVVWQPSSDRLWEFRGLRRGARGWSAASGGAIQNVSSSSGVYGSRAWPGATIQWGATGSSLSIVGGLITFKDLARHHIPHALAMAVPEVSRGVYTAPARRSDGTSGSPLSLPEGARLRLDPRLSLRKLHASRLVRSIAEAAQKYGIVVRGWAPQVTLYAQDPVSLGTEDPYIGIHGYSEGHAVEELLAGFPWSRLQLLKMDLRLAPGA